MSGPLEGLLVADFSRVLAGPFATMLLGDLGADVVKVEHPGGGDETRAWGPPFHHGDSTYYLAVNRNKRSVALDLKTRRRPAGRPGPGRPGRRAGRELQGRRRWSASGSGSRSCAGTTRGLVWCSISGFGRAGRGGAARLRLPGPGDERADEHHRPGRAASPPRSGWPWSTCSPGCTPSAASWPPCASGSGPGAGSGSRSACSARPWPAWSTRPRRTCARAGPPRAMGNRHPSITPYETLATADRPLVVAVGNDGQFARLCRVLGLPEAAADPRFATNADRVRHRDELAALLERALAARGAADWVAALADAGVPCGLVNDVGEAFALAERLGLGAGGRGRRGPPGGQPDPACRPPPPPTGWPRRPSASTPPRCSAGSPLPHPATPGQSPRRSPTYGFCGRIAWMPGTPGRGKRWRPRAAIRHVRECLQGRRPAGEHGGDGWQGEQAGRAPPAAGGAAGRERRPGRGAQPSPGPHRPAQPHRLAARAGREPGRSTAPTWSCSTCPSRTAPTPSGRSAGASSDRWSCSWPRGTRAAGCTSTTPPPS